MTLSEVGEHLHPSTSHLPDFSAGVGLGYLPKVPHWVSKLLTQLLPLPPIIPVIPVKLNHPQSSESFFRILYTKRFPHFPCIIRKHLFPSTATPICHSASVYTLFWSLRIHASPSTDSSRITFWTHRHTPQTQAPRSPVIRRLVLVPVLAVTTEMNSDCPPTRTQCQSSVGVQERRQNSSGKCIT